MTEAAQRTWTALLEPLVDPASRTYWPLLLLAAGVACALHLWHSRLQTGSLRAKLWTAIGGPLWRHRSCVLDLQLLLARQLLGLLGLIPVLGSAYLLATGIVIWLDHSIGVPSPPQLPPVLLGVVYTGLLFIVWDLSRYLLHRLMHQVPALWQFHQVHHSAEVLTPLTFHRVHPVESMLYSLRGLLSSGVLAGLVFWLYRGQAVELTLLGVHSMGFLLNAATGNLRHSHVWLGFGPHLERWLLSPAQHQVHHGVQGGANYGTWLACWDRMAGTLCTSPAHRPVLGLSSQNHAPDDLLSALLAPFPAALRTLRPRRWAPAAAAVLCLLAGAAQAEQSEETAEEETADGSMIVTAEGKPRVAGAAIVITEEELARHRYTSIHQVLASVPGVYLRGEDGFGLRPNIGLRGGNSDRSAKITLMEDGVLMAPAPYAAPAAYYFPLSQRLVGVEVIKGAAAIRHGPQTIGGAVNLLTRRTPRETIAAVESAYGLHHTIQAHGYGGTGRERWGVLAEIAHLSSDGFKVIDGGGPTGFGRQDAMFKARLGTARDARIFHDVELKLGYGRERSHETYLGLSASDFGKDPDRRYAASRGDLMQWQRTQESLTWRMLAGQSVDLRTVIYHHHLSRDWLKLNRFAGGPSLHDLLYQGASGGQAEVYMAILEGEEDSSSADQLLMKGSNDRDFQSYGVQTVAHHRMGEGAIMNELELGLRLHIDQVRRLHTESPYEMTAGQLVAADGETVSTLDSHNSAHAVAAHLHNDLSLGPLRILPGLRYERIQTASGTTGTGPIDPQTQQILLPGLGLYWAPLDWLGLLTGVHRGFSPVSPGSPEDTEPETAWNYEAGLRASLGQTRLESIGFFSDYANLTGQCTLSGGCTDQQLDTQFNGGEAEVYGIESTVGHEILTPWGIAIDLDLSHAWTHATFGSDFVSEFPQFGRVQAGDTLPYIPAHQGAIAMALTHDGGTLSVKTTGRSGMRNEAGSEAVPEIQQIPAHHQTDLGAQLRIRKGWAATASLTNITRNRSVASFRPFGARPTAPFQAMIGLRAEL
jgi:Fe(3+) dicitrate transport protein